MYEKHKVYNISSHNYNTEQNSWINTVIADQYFHWAHTRNFAFFYVSLIHQGNMSVECISLDISFLYSKSFYVHPWVYVFLCLLQNKDCGYSLAQQQHAEAVLTCTQYKFLYFEQG